MCQYDTSSPFRKILYTAPKVLYVVTFVLVVILYAHIRNDDPTFQGPETRILQRIFTNVHKFPINYIEVADFGKCPSNTETVNLGTWSGTTPGCLCSNSLILSQACTSSNTGCEDIASVAGSPFSTWSTKAICVQRLTTINYPAISDCPDGTTICGAGMCVPAGVSCPFTDLKIMTNGATVPPSYIPVPFNTTHSIYYATDIKDEPIVDIMVSLYDEPCMDPLSQPFSKDKVQFPLSVIPENGCSIGGAIDHLLNIDVLEVPKLFQENNITSRIQNLPSYVSYVSDEVAYLVGLRQYTIRNAVRQCGTVDPALFAELDQYEDTFRSSIKGILIAAVSLSSVLFFTIIIELILRIKDVRRIKYMKLFAYGNLLLIFFAGILYIVSGSFSIRAKIDLDPNLKYLKVLSKSQCFQQEVVNRILQVYQDEIWDIYTLIWVSIVLLILSSAGIILALVLVAIDNFTAAGESNTNASYYRGIGDGPKKNKNIGGNKTVSNVELLLKGK